ncbi:unnamed protein product, partial [Pylaiella littoralis]
MFAKTTKYHQTFGSSSETYATSPDTSRTMPWLILRDIFKHTRCRIYTQSQELKRFQKMPPPTQFTVTFNKRRQHTGGHRETRTPRSDAHSTKIDGIEGETRRRKRGKRPHKVKNE